MNEITVHMLECIKFKLTNEAKKSNVGKVTNRLRIGLVIVRFEFDVHLRLSFFLCAAHII